jgi:hypothetical protein
MDLFFRWFNLDPFTRIDRIRDFRFITESWLPSEVVWALAAVGLLLAGINFLPAIRMQRRVRLLCFVFRLGMLGLLLLVLLRTHLKLDIQMARAQSWLALVDDSGSMRTEDARGGTRFSAAVADVDVLRKAVGRKVALDVASLSAAPLGREAGEKTSTRIHSAILRELAERPRVQRVILLTDGRDVETQDFSLTGEALKSRGVALDIGLYGTEKPSVDSRLAAQPERTVIRLGESLVIRGSLQDAAGSDSRNLKLLENGKPVRTVTVPRESYGWFEVIYRPEKAGRHRYTLSMETEDAYRGNDACSFFVDVRDEKINVLMIEGLPRYEFKLLKIVLETDPLVYPVCVSHLPGGGVYVQGGALHDEAGVGVIQSATELFKYDLVILRDVPRTLFRIGSDTNEISMKLLASFVEKRGGGLVTLGGQSVYRAGGYQDSPLAEILPFDLSDSFSKKPQFPGRFPVRVVNEQYDHPLLRLLPDATANKELWDKLPMLDGCNNVGAVKPMGKPLLSRLTAIQTPSGGMETREVPVLAIQDLGGGKILSASVDTFWRWQLQPNIEPPPLETLMANIVRYLAPEPGLRAGNVNVVIADPAPVLGQTVVLSTLLRDKNYDPVRLADLKVVVTKPDGQILTIYPCDLPDRPGYYEYRFLADQPGDWSAVALLGKDRQTAQFVVREQDDEFAELAVGREAMRALAAAAGGSVIETVSAWAKRADVSPVKEPASRDLEVWNSPAILVLFILLVCADCFVRKRQGLA